MTQKSYKFIWAFLVVLTGIIGVLLVCPVFAGVIGGVAIGFLATLLLGVALVGQVLFLITKKTPPED